MLGLGLFSNRLILIWAGATVAAALLVTLVPAVRAILRATVLCGPEWMLAVGLALAGTF